MSAEPILRVAVPAPFRHALDYLPPADTDHLLLQPGVRVVVPLGSRKVMGVIVEVITQSDVAAARLRRIVSVPDPKPVLPPDVLALCLWAAQYYHAPLGDVVVNTLPAELRDTTRRRKTAHRQWRATPDSGGLDAQALHRAPRQAEALRILRQHGVLRDSDCSAAGIDLAALRALQRKGLALAETSADSTQPAQPAPLPGVTPQLNEDQRSALQSLEALLGRFACCLLEGVTGSGKTEVYLRLIDRVLANGQQALVLVPEIGLTPQIRRRFKERFGDRITVLHSGLSDGARLRAWEAAASGAARVLIGTRSALFSPLPDLGVIIVDEEHDGSFKQQDGFRYSARDLAIFRARQRAVPIVLGSATPSPESLANCESTRFVHLTLPQRAGAAQSPSVMLIDIRGCALNGGMSQPLLTRIGAELSAGNQVLVFLNRRGWAPVFTCSDCGWMAACHACDARLTMHRERGLLWCHHCDFKTSVPHRCPVCNSAHMVALGAGTERSEHSLQQLFPQYPIYRIDRGTMQAKDAMDDLIGKLEGGEPCILVGTQMLAKGHHFPAVTLVAIIDLDGGLFSSDFRAAERTGQLLVQVSGRAGRAERPGDVLIQTLHPTHPWLERLVHGGYRAFIDPIMLDRKARGLPPYTHLAVLRVECVDHEVGLQLLQNVKRRLAVHHADVDVLGPVPANMPRRAGRHRLQILLKHCQRAPLHAALDTVCRLFDSERMPGIDRWLLDVDPLEGA